GAPGIRAHHVQPELELADVDLLVVGDRKCVVEDRLARLDVVVRQAVAVVVRAPLVVPPGQAVLVVERGIGVGRLAHRHWLYRTVNQHPFDPEPARGLRVGYRDAVGRAGAVVADERSGDGSVAVGGPQVAVWRD